MALDVGLRSASATHSDADPSGIDPDLVAVLNDDPWQILSVRDSEGVGNRRHPGKALSLELRRLVSVKKNCDRHLSFASAQYRSDAVAGFDLEAKSLEEVRASFFEHPSCPRVCFVPIRAGANTGLKLMRCKQP